MSRHRRKPASAPVNVAVNAANFASAEGDEPDFSRSIEVLLHQEDSTPLMIGTAGTPTVVAAPSNSMFQTACIPIRLICFGTNPQQLPSKSYRA